jgi:hypothetical protein
VPGIIQDELTSPSYHWEGDLILHDTVIESRRSFNGGPDRVIGMDIRKLVSFGSSASADKIMRRLVEEKRLPRGKGRGDFDRCAMILWDFIARNVSYLHDSERPGGRSACLLPHEVGTLRKGDCEDSSVLLASLLIACGISPFCVRVVLGEISDENGRLLGSHCWPIYKSESGRWCILESTLDSIPSRMPEADKLTTYGQSFQYIPFYCFNHHHLWKISPEHTAASKALSLGDYLRQRGNKVHMRKTKLPSGGWLSRITAEWEPGHARITEEVLEAAGLSRGAVVLAGDASQDPDFYDWYTPAAHAQTDNDTEGRTIESRSRAETNHVQWIRGLTRKLVRYALKDARSALFFLGYALHGVQDLATHRGITNAQHSFTSRLFEGENDPDHNEELRTKARSYTEQYVEFLKRAYPKSWERLAAYHTDHSLPDVLTPSDKARLLNKKGWDLTPRVLLEQSRLKSKYRRMRNDYPVGSTLWETDTVFKRLITKER